MPIPLAAMAAPAAIKLVTGFFGARKRAKASRRAGGILSDAAGEASQELRDVTGQAAGGITEAAEGAATGVETAAGQANETFRDLNERSLGLTDPFTSSGGEAVGTLTDIGQNPEEFRFNPEDDPGFQFRLREGQKALERSAAARGGLQSGGTLKSLARFSQGLASDEFQRAFDRFDTNRKFRAGTLTDVAELGLRGVGHQLVADSAFGRGTLDATLGGAEASGRFRLRGAESSGDLSVRGTQAATNVDLSGASAKAAGEIGSANAWANFLGNAGNLATDIGEGIITRGVG